MTNRFLRTFALCAIAAGLVILNSGCSREAKAQRYVARGDKDFAEGKYQRAEIEYLSAVRLGSTNSAAMAGLGMVYFQQGKIPQAYGAFTRALQLDPGNTAARIKLGMVCRSLGQTTLARQHAAQALDKHPGSDDALMLLVDSSSTAEEIQDCLRRIEAIPQANKGGMAEHLARGSIKFRQRDIAGAEDEFKQAMARDPKSERPHMALASVYIARKQMAEAEAALKTAAQLAPLRSPVRIHYAKFLLNAGKSDEARKSVTEITQKAPDYMPAWTFLADSAFKEGKQEECAEFVKRILERDPANYEGLNLNGKLLLAKGDAPGAIKQFEWIVQSYGTNAEHFYNLALAQVQNRWENQAIVTLDRALASETNYVDAVILQSTLLLRQGSFGRVASSLRDLISRGERLAPSEQARLPVAFALLARAQAGLKNISAAVATYDAMRKSFPGLIEVHLEAGNGFASFNRTNEAVKAYQQYVGLSTNSIGLLLAGNGLARLNDIKSARVAFDKIRTLTPDFTPAIEALVQMDIREGKFDDALARAKAEIDKPNSGGLPWLLQANVHLEKAAALARKTLGENVRDAGFITLPAAQDDIKAAEAALIKANEIDPALTTAYHLLARIWVAANKHKEALEKLTSLTSRTNDLTAQIQIALIQDQAGDYKAAAEAYEKALEFAPDSIEALNNLAGIYSVQIPRLDRAHELADKARRNAPNFAPVADTLGWVLYKQGQYGQALALLEDASRALPDEPEVDYHLGMTCYMLGQEEAAKAALQRVAASPRDFPGKAEAPVCLAVLAIDPAKADKAAVDTLEKRTKENPGDPVALARLAAVLERDRSYDRAAETYEAILKTTPGNAQAAFNLARLYADHLGQTDKALEMAKTARANAPEDPQIAHLFGRLSWLKGNWAYALTLLEESARKLPNDPGVACDLGWAFYSLGRVAEAEAQMKSAAAAPGFTKAEDCRRFVKFLTAAGNPALAAQITSEIDQALKADANYVPALYLSAAGEERSKNHARAAQLYERILAIYPSFAPATRDLAIITFENLNQDQKAYELAVKARAAFPSDPLLARTLGILSFKRGENPRAAQILREASESRQGDAELFYYLGMAQRALRSKTDARQSLERAISLKLPESLATEATTALAELKK